MNDLNLLVTALVTVVSQYAGYLALRKELRTKADQRQVDEHDVRLKVLENAHGGVLR